MRNIQKLNLDNFKARYESTSHEYKKCSPNMNICMSSFHYDKPDCREHKQLVQLITVHLRLKSSEVIKPCHQHEATNTKSQKMIRIPSRTKKVSKKEHQTRCNYPQKYCIYFVNTSACFPFPLQLPTFFLGSFISHFESPLKTSAGGVINNFLDFF